MATEDKIPKKVKTCNWKVDNSSTLLESDSAILTDLNNIFMNHTFNENNEIVPNIDNNQYIVGRVDQNIQNGNRGPLYSESIYFLNRSRTKWIAIGLCPDRHFDPLVRIMGKGQCITLLENDWKNILCYKSSITNGFAGDAPSNLILCGLNISRDWIENSRKVLKLERAMEYICLAYDSLHELWKIGDLVSNRLDVLKSLNYNNYYDDIIAIIAPMTGNVKQNVISVLNATLNEQTCITKKLLIYGIGKILWDIDLLNIIQM